MDNQLGEMDLVPQWLKRFQKYAIPVGTVMLAGLAYVILFKKRKT